MRWFLAMSLAMLAAGTAEYVVASRQLTAHALEQSMQGFEVQAGALEDALQTSETVEERERAITAELGHIGHTYGVQYTGLFDRSGTSLASAGVSGDPDAIDPDRLAEVLATGRPTVESETDAGETDEVARYEYLLPVRTPDGLRVLEVDQREETITRQVSDLRLRKVLGLLVALLFAVPLSYAFGGRTLHRRQLRSERQADTDALTGLAGRRPFRPTLEAALAHATATPVVLALIDLDGFKQVNDRRGHSYGDQILVALADSFGELRAADSAFRLGGDEFAVILPGTNELQADEVLERVRASLALTCPEVTFSCGISLSPPGGARTLQELWERSDAALYEAKRRGRRQTVTFASMSAGRTVSAEKLDAVTALLREDSAMTAAFQPIWDLRLGVVLAHEALLRLPVDSPVDGPQEAFELAQRLGVAAALDARARQTVLSAVRDRDWQGLLFLNIHPDSLAQLDVDALVVDLAAAGLEPADVVLEVTEQAGLDHPEPIRVLKQAHRLGFRLALDDMGQSNAGLRALTLVRFDVVKLDRMVVARLGADPASSATVAAATTFVQQTGGWVIAEGIEEPEMLAALLGGTREAAAGYQPVLAGQGYLLGRPQRLPVGLDARLSVLDEPSPLLAATPAASGASPGPAA